jgi:colanic acid/amylovoran biosynthesis protein
LFWGEYYGSRAWRHLLTYWVTAQASPVVLLGQTIGPFEMPKNRLAARFLMPSLTVVARDRWTTSYLQSEFGLGDRLVQGSDLAWADLPLQHRQDIEADILNRFGLLPDSYATIVISGMQGAGYYTPDRGLYLQRWKETVEGLLDLPQMAGRRICLLAHTYGIYGDESRNVVDVFSLLSEEARQRVVPVPDRILPTRARFILGNGLFTISGRMHPAVSTFQMGKPAIALAYSKKYNGVIGTMIGRGDLILDANDPALWSSGEIVSAMLALAADVLARHQTLCTEIRQAVAVQKGIVKTSLDNAVAMVHAL